MRTYGTKSHWEAQHAASTRKLNGEAWAAPAFVCSAMKNTAFEEVEGKGSPYHREGKTTPQCKVIVPSHVETRQATLTSTFYQGSKLFL